VTAPAAVLVLAGTGNLAVQYVCAAGHGASTVAKAATLPEHGSDVAAYEAPPYAKMESRVVLSCEGLILEKLIDLEIPLENHDLAREPAIIYDHLRLLQDVKWKRAEL
jgi:hypothetical protein